MTDVSVDERWDDQGADDDLPVVSISPGNILTELEWRGVMAAASEAFGLPLDDIVVSPYGYVPLPRPPEPEPDGRGKVPAGVAFSLALHPVFWLDDFTKRQRPGEDDDRYHVRMWFELANRGLLDPGTQEPLNPFLAAEIDTLDPEVQDDIVEYLDGQRVGWLCDFTVAAQPETASGEIDRIVDRLVEKHRRNYHARQQQLAEGAEAMYERAFQRIYDANFKRSARWVVDSGEALRKNPSDSVAAQTLEEAVDGVLAEMRELDMARRIILAAFEYQVNGAFVTSVDEHTDRVDEADADRRATVDAAVGAVILSPDADTLAELWKTMKRSWDDVVQHARDVVNDHSKLQDG